MENKNTPAFPDPARASSKEMIAGEFPGRFPTGLTKREYIAARIMQGISGSDRYKGWEFHEMADRAVKLTDAILSALEK